MARPELSRSPALSRKPSQQEQRPLQDWQRGGREQEQQQQRGRDPLAAQSAAMQAQYGNRLTSAAIQADEVDTGPAALIHAHMALGVAGIAAGDDLFGAMGNRAAGLALAGLEAAGIGVGDPFGGATVDRHPGHGGGRAGETGAGAAVARARGAGSPLPAAVRAEAEARLGGASLGAVRVHTDGAAQQAAAAVEARAFTVGTHVWFGAGEFAPETMRGRELLLHELTHVMQNLRGDPQGAPSEVIDGVGVSSPGDRREQEAESVAARASRGPVPQAEGQAGPEIGAEIGAEIGQGSEVGQGAEIGQGVGQQVGQQVGQETGPTFGQGVVERDKQTNIRSAMDATYNALTNILVQVPVKMGEATWRVPVTIRAHYRINQNNDAGERQYGRLRSERPSAIETDPETREKKVNKSLKEAEAAAGQGKATPTEYKQVIQAALDQGLVDGIPVVLARGDAQGQALTDQGAAKVERQARQSIGKYAQYSYGVDCSGFVYQAVRQARQGQGLDGEWGNGIMGTGSQSPRESGIGTKIPTADAYQSGDLMVTPGHIRMVYQRTEVTGDEATRLRKELDLAAGAQIYQVQTYESAPARPTGGHAGYYGKDKDGKDLAADTNRWGLNKQTFLVVQTTTPGNPRKKIKPKTSVQWYTKGESGYEPTSNPAIQRVQTGKDQNRNGTPIQRKGAGPVAAGASVDPKALGGGSPLPAELRAQAEAAFGVDLGDVRVHADGAAGRAAEAINARAFTTGSDIVFAPGRFAPGTPAGEQLLMHELTHVIQQREGAVGGDGGAVNHDQGLEAEADRLAQQVMSGAAVGPVSGAGAGVQREAGPNDILFQHETAGASKATASQDGIKQGGVGASEQMAGVDHKRVMAYQEVFIKVAAEFNLPPALLAAIASRETRGGKQLDAKGYSLNDGQGFGIMQVDKNSHTPKGSPGGETHIRQAAGILAGFREQMREKFPGASEDQLLQAAVAAYNAGPRRVKDISSPDRSTTGKDYSSDVWARARFFAPDFGGAPQEGSSGGGGIYRDGIGPAPAEHGFSPEMATGGERLPSAVQGKMESAFGADFSGVRVHTDGAAAGLSTGLNARAFTYGAHIFFGAGQYSPGTLAGDRLLAHELTHTTQQGASQGVALKGAGSGVPVVDGNGAQERAAERKGEDTAQKLALLKALKTKSNAELRRMLYGADGKKIDIDAYSGLQKEILEAAEAELESRLEPKAGLGAEKLNHQRSLGQGQYTYTPHTDAIVDERTSRRGNTVFTYRDAQGRLVESPGYGGSNPQGQFSRDAREGRIEAGTGWNRDQGDRTMQIVGHRTDARGRQVVIYQAPDGTLKEKAGRKGESRDDLTRRFTEEQRLKGGGEVRLPVQWQGHQNTVRTQDRELFRQEAGAEIAKSEGSSAVAGGTLDHRASVGEVKAGATGRMTKGKDGRSVEVEAGVEAKLVDFSLTQSWETGVLNMFGEQVSGRIYLVLRGMVGVEAKAKLTANARRIKGQKQPDLKQITAGTDLEVKQGGSASAAQRVRAAAGRNVEAGASARAEAFAGAKLQIAAGFAIDWHQKAPEIYKTRLTGAINGLLGLIHPGLAWLFRKAGGNALLGKLNGLLGWREGVTNLLGIEVGAAGSLGVGAHLDAAVGFQGGKFRFQWSMGVTWGLGLGTTLNVTIDAKEGVKFALAIGSNSDMRKLVENWFKSNIKKVIGGAGALWDSITGWFSADDKIREMVSHRYHEVATPQERAKMIKTLIGGWCGGDDEQAVLKILEFSKRNGDLSRVLASGVSRDAILSALDGQNDTKARAILG